MLLHASSAEEACSSMPYKSEPNRPLREPPSTERERPVSAEVRVAERLDRVAEAVRQREQKTVVRRPLELERPAGPEVEPAADEDEGDVIQGVRVSLAQLVRPDNHRVVEQRTLAA